MNQELILEKRLDALRSRHRQLDERINAMLGDQTDELGIKRLKIEKLRLRDEICHLEKLVYPDVPA